MLVLFKLYGHGLNATAYLSYHFMTTVYTCSSNKSLVLSEAQRIQLYAGVNNKVAKWSVYCLNSFSELALCDYV